MAVDDVTGTPGSEGADDSVQADVEQPEGADGGDTAAHESERISVEELQAQIREERAARMAYERMLAQGGEPAGGHDDPPTQPDPRAALDQRAHAIDEELAEAEAQVRLLAGRKDAASIYALAQAKAYRAQLQTLQSATAKALTLMWDTIQTMQVPEDSRTAFDQFYRENKGAFASKSAAISVWKSMQKLNATTTTPTPTTTPAARTVTRPAPRPSVDTTVRPVPSREAAARTMSGDQFDAEMEALRRAGHFDQARELQARYASGEIVIQD